MRLVKNLLFCVVLSVALLSPNAFLPAPVPKGYSAVAGRALRCATCGRIIRGRYFKLKGKYYCSKRCLEKSLPKCCICGRPARFHSGRKYYCSKRCLEKSWPVCACCHRFSRNGVRRGYEKIFLCPECATKPKCFACSMPGDFGRFSDGRHICKRCRKAAVMDYASAVRLANEVRSVMREKLGLATNHRVIYKLVGRNELGGKNDGGQSGTELGLYTFEQTIEAYTLTKIDYLGRKTTTEKKREKPARHTIYLLYGTPGDKLVEVIAHELGHDWMQEHMPGIRELVLKEGWAEYVASLVNAIYGRSCMNKRMFLNKDPVYGGGYRKLLKVSRHGGLKAVVAYLEKFNTKSKNVR